MKTRVKDGRRSGMFIAWICLAALLSCSLAVPASATDCKVAALVSFSVPTLTISSAVEVPAATPNPSIVVIVKPNVDPPRDAFERGVKVSLVGVVRNHPGTVNPLIKSNSLLNNALAMQEALRHGSFEGVMRNYKGELAECTQSNLFIVKDGAALTPPIDSGYSRSELSIRLISRT